MKPKIFAFAIALASIVSRCHATPIRLGACLAVVLLLTTGPAGAQPTVTIVSPTNGQQLVALTSIAGNFQTNGAPVAQIMFSIYDQSSGQWWNGTAYQAPYFQLPVTVTGTNWASTSGLTFPPLCCEQTYQITATVTDTNNQTGSATITVQAESVPPVVTFGSLTNGQIVANLSAIGGSVTDSFTTVASVVFTIHELDINGGPGRWWDGTNFQASPAPLPTVISDGNWSPAADFALPALNSGQSYVLTATATDTLSNSASASIAVTDYMTILSWDPGQSPEGTVILPNPNTNGGNYWFKINPQSPAMGVWRTALNVLQGQAGVYMSQGYAPNIYNGQFVSSNPGSNGFVLDASQFNPGQDWYILVNASTNAQWNLVSGDVYVYQLGSLATDNSSSTNAPVGAEGMIFFQTTIPSTTAAWQLWINGLTNQMYVKKSAAPDPVSHDLMQAGQMLVVPPYLATSTFNGYYFIGVSGTPGTTINLDSRQQPIIPLLFSSLTNVIVAPTNFPYVTYQVQVPVQQIAWQLNLTPINGNPGIAVRRNLVPNEFRNDAFSEVPPGVGASVSLVPPPPNSGAGTPGLSDGTFYVTIYSTASYSCSFTNANPVITDVHYLFSVINDAPTRSGWRYYRVTTIAEQLGTLGWALSLANQVSGTEIALRRNAVPGQWNYRNNDDNYYSQSLGYVDLSSAYGLLEQPGHQADIWYVGVYTPAQALGNFVLTGNQLIGQPMSLDGTGNTVSVTNSFPGEWQFFEVTVPADTNLLGWDVRLVDVTAGSPQLVVGRDTLPVNLSTSWGGWPPNTYDPNDATSWPSDSVTMLYNRQGQVKSRTDQLGTVHTLEYDLLGRQTQDRVTTLGTNVDGAVLRTATTYEVRSMVQDITNYDNATVGAGNVVNDLQNAYNDFSQLITQYQSHSGAVNTGSTPAVQYEYADGSANTIRLTSITYPNGRVLTISYGTSGAMNDQLSRVESLIDGDGTTHLADYSYLGMSQIVEVSSPQLP